MSGIIKVIVISLLSIIVLLGLAGCSSGVPQEEYDAVKSQLSNLQTQLAALQSSLAEAAQNETKYEELQAQYDAKIAELQDVKAQLDALETQMTGGQVDVVTQAEYDSLKAKYDALKSQYDALTQKAVFTETDIDQAIFKLINEARKDAGVAELVWSKNLYNWGRQNSLEMSQKDVYQYSSWASWSEIFWAANYPSVESIADAALMTWKTNDYRFRYNVINVQCIYGAVATYKSDDIYYITYMASNFE